METYCFFLVFLISVTQIYVTLGCSSFITGNTRYYYNTIYLTCTTDECINASSEISAKLNRKVDPCDNFYEFACGGWIQNHRVSERNPYVDSYVAIERGARNQLQGLLEEPVKKGDILSMLKAKHIYAQCVNYKNNTTFELNYGDAIWNEYFERLWNTTSRTWEKEIWKENYTEWQSFSDDLHTHGFNNGLFDIYVTKDSMITNTNVIKIGPSKFSPSDMSAYTTISSLIEMFRVPNSNISLENITLIASEIESFANELYDLKIISSRTSEKHFSLTIQEWQEYYDKLHPNSNAQIDWHLTIQKLFVTHGITIEPSERLLISANTYFRSLVPLLERTPSHIIINYMKWTVVYQLSLYVKRSNTGSFARSMTWKTCLYQFNLKSAIFHEYVKKYASHLNITTLKEIGSDVKLAFAENIKQSTWMDENTRQESLKKLAYMKLNFSKPDWYSDEAIDRYYEDLNVNMEYVENIRNIYLFERKMMLKSLRTHVPKTLRVEEPTQVNAFFVHAYNKLVVTAAILNPPLYYNIRRPLSIIYGSLGFIIAHEIIHGYDVKGREFDKDGKKVQWWTEGSRAAFDNLTQCFVEQYDRYLRSEFENDTIHGEMTLSENIADSAGIVTAFHAYKIRKARLNEKEWRLHGLEQYSTEQMFFILYAQMFCANHHPSALDELLLDVHALAEFRVRGGLSNSRDFSKVYNCSVGKPMNPEKKCFL